MKKYLVALSIAGLGAVAASAGTINYNTNGSTLLCNGVSGCTQITSTQLSVNGLTLTYNAGSAANVQTPSIINFGNLVTTGTASNENLTGLLLTIVVSSTPPGASGSIPNGTISGTISTNSSQSIIQFAPNNTTTAFGTLPGVIIAGPGGTPSYTYQVLNPTLGIVAPTPADGIPGQTSIQGAVTDTSAPEPTTLVLLGLGLGAVGIMRRRSA